MPQNPRCVSARCARGAGEVRLLPAAGAHLAYCRDCYAQEMHFRAVRNDTLAPEVRYDMPRWDDLKLHTEE